MGSWETTISRSLFSGFEELRKDNTLADITIVVEGKEFKCHKFLLCAMSGFFKTMFNSGYRESRKKKIDLQNVDEESFSRILDIFYSGKDVITPSNAWDLMQTGIYLQIDSLRDKCQTFLRDTLDYKNCIRLLKLARDGACRYLAKEAEECMVENFGKVSRTEDVLDLDFEDLITILSKSDLDIKEEELCDAAFRWLQKDSARHTYSASILPLLRLPRTSGQYLFRLQQQYPFLLTLPGFMGYLQEAIQFQLVPSKRHHVNTSRTEHRRCSGYEDVIMVVAGTVYKKVEPDFGLGSALNGNQGQEVEKKLQSTSSVLAYSFQSKSWYNAPAMPKPPGKGFTCTPYGDHSVYVIGGENCLKDCYKYCCLLNRWQRCKGTVTAPRLRNHAACVMGNYIYAFGGIYQEKCVFKFHIELEVWSSCLGNLSSTTTSAACSSIDEKIYLFQRDTSQHVPVQCYDTITETCVAVVMDTSLLGIPITAVTLEDRIYVVSEGLAKDSAPFVMEFKNDTLTTVSNALEECKTDFGVVQVRGEFICLGGRTKTQNGSIAYDTASKFSVECEREIKSLPRMKLADPRYGFGMVRIAMKRKALH